MAERERSSNQDSTRARSAATVDAVVVGSGPNGLTAAALLARAGRSVHVIEASSTLGGGTRTAELTLPGVLHDVCSAVHPFGAASPAFAELELDRHGLDWCHPEVDVAHPLDGGRCGALVTSLEGTTAGLGSDGAAWRRTFAPLTDRASDLAGDILGPLLRVPSHPLALARFGLSAALPATWLARRWDTEEARALWAGIAAHVYRPLDRLFTASAGAMFIAQGHRTGWPVARGGSRAIADALVAAASDAGATFETERTVRSMGDLPPHRTVLFDTTPQAVVAIAGPLLPGRVRRAYERYRFGPGAFKVDLAVEGGIPWTSEPARRAGTVHLGGTLEEVAAAEADLHRGRMPERPFVLVGQQYLADPSRSVGDLHPVWAYAHVPHGWRGDATEAILDQIERFAPGARDRVIAVAVRSTEGLETDNPNYVGGDVAGGSNELRQLVARPRFALDPYSVGVEGMYLCSAATPPGAGVHGMGGYHAARRALAHLDRSD